MELGRGRVDIGGRGCICMYGTLGVKGRLSAVFVELFYILLHFFTFYFLFYFLCFYVFVFLFFGNSSVYLGKLS